MFFSRYAPILKAGLFLLAVFSTTLPGAALANSSTAEGLIEKMLDRLGGRQNWANLRNTINGSKQNRALEPTVVYSVITMDFEQPRFRIDTTGENINLVRVINGDRSWRISWSGLVEDLPDVRMKDDILWYQAHIYRTIHRIANRDPKLTFKVLNEDQLEVYAGEDRLLWLRLDAKGEPLAFGFYQDEEGSLCGPWDIVKSGVRHPSWVSSGNGEWRAAIKALEFNVPLHSSTFERPSS
jgi:hypothetical protein